MYILFLLSHSALVRMNSRRRLVRRLGCEGGTFCNSDHFAI